MNVIVAITTEDQTSKCSGHTLPSGKC